MLSYDITHERLMDIGFILVALLLYVLIYAYGEWRYQKGLDDGLKRRRKVDRAVRRGEVYRLK